jgi:feruloyl-CoA synthase
LRSQANSGSSLRIERLMLMAEPPSIDANEIADKGYVNQSVTRARRAHFVEQLFQTPPAEHIASAQ